MVALVMAELVGDSHHSSWTAPLPPRSTLFVRRVTVQGETEGARDTARLQLCVLDRDPAGGQNRLWSTDLHRAAFQRYVDELFTEGGTLAGHGLRWVSSLSSPSRVTHARQVRPVPAGQSTSPPHGVCPDPHRPRGRGETAGGDPAPVRGHRTAGPRHPGPGARRPARLGGRAVGAGPPGTAPPVGTASTRPARPAPREHGDPPRESKDQPIGHRGGGQVGPHPRTLAYGPTRSESDEHGGITRVVRQGKRDVLTRKRRRVGARGAKLV